MDIKYDCIIIGGGIAGISIALNILKYTDYRIAIFEREERLGGVLNQCIHEGFGLTYLKKNLTGPEYLSVFLEQLTNLNLIDKRLTIYKSTEVLDVCKYGEDFKVRALSREGFIKVKSKALIYSTGCSERHVNNLYLNKNRVKGIYTAGQAQDLINIKGNIEIFRDKKIVIVGTGDIGMITARRFKIEGANVEYIIERNSKISGSYRNKIECLDKYDVKLKLDSELIGIAGDEIVEGIYILSKDKEEFLDCDIVISSIGLIPEEDLVLKEKGVFRLGNGDYVHDVVDDINFEADILYKEVDKYLKTNIYEPCIFNKHEKRLEAKVLCTLCPKSCVKDYSCDKGRENNHQQDLYSITTSIEVLDGTKRRLFAKTELPVSLERRDYIIKEIKSLRISNYINQKVELENKEIISLSVIEYKNKL